MTASQSNLRRTLAALLLLLCLNFAALAQTSDDAATAKAIDELVSKAYPADAPGASVVVIKEGRTLLRKGYGMADVELGVLRRDTDEPRLPDARRLGAARRRARHEQADARRGRGRDTPAKKVK